MICDNNLDDEENIILGGDFNCPIDPSLDKKGGVLSPRRAVVERILCMQSELDLIDICRIRNPSMKSYSWSQKSPCVFCRLDYWLISNNLQDFVQSINISPAIRTDHAAIDLSIGDIEKGDNGPGFWKFNFSLLDDENYVDEVKNYFQMWIAEGEKDLQDKRAIWDWLKFNIRSHAINYSKIKSRQKRETETRLQNELEFSEATRKFEDDPSEDHKSRLVELKEKLELIYDEKVKGVIIRARA